LLLAKKEYLVVISEKRDVCLYLVVISEKRDVCLYLVVISEKRSVCLYLVVISKKRDVWWCFITLGEDYKITVIITIRDRLLLFSFEGLRLSVYLCWFVVIRKKISNCY